MTPDEYFNVVKLQNGIDCSKDEVRIQKGDQIMYSRLNIYANIFVFGIGNSAGLIIRSDAKK